MCILTSTQYVCPFCRLTLTAQPIAALVPCPARLAGQSCTQRSYFDLDDDLDDLHDGPQQTSRVPPLRWDGAYDIVRVTDESMVCAGCFRRAEWAGRAARVGKWVRQGLRRVWRWGTDVRSVRVFRGLDGGLRVEVSRV